MASFGGVALRRCVVVAILASGMLAACQPTPPGGVVAPPRIGTSDVAMAYQQNVAHSGVATGSTLKGPLTLRWRRNFDNYITSPTVSHPIIVGGRVFVTSAIFHDTDLVWAFDLATGRRLWGPVRVEGYGLRSGLAYGSGRLIVSNSDADFRALDPATGRILWTRDLLGDTETSPVVSHGLVLAGTEAGLWALDVRDGSPRWKVNIFADQSSPAVSGDRIYIRHLDWTYALDFSGRSIWTHRGHLYGAGDRTAVVYAGRVYARDPLYTYPDQVFSAASGQLLGNFDSVYAPSFNNGAAIVTQGAIDCYPTAPCTVRAVDLTTGAVRWSYVGDGTTDIAPLVVNDTAYIGSNDGHLTALNARTGAPLWSEDVHRSFDKADEHNSGEPLVGLATGRGYLAVPAQDDLLVYGPAGPALSTDDNSALFAPTPAGFAGPPAKVTIRSTGAQTAAVTRVRIEGRRASMFKVTSTCLGARLAPRATCQASITYRPTGGTIHSATLVIHATGSAMDVHIALRGSVR